MSEKRETDQSAAHSVSDADSIQPYTQKVAEATWVGMSEASSSPEAQFNDELDTLHHDAGAKMLFYALDVEELITSAWRGVPYSDLPSEVRQALRRAAHATSGFTQSATASSDVVRDGQRHALVEVICALQERVESLAVQLISAQKDTEQWRFKLRLACDAGMAAHRGDSEWNALNDLLRQSFDAARSSVEPVESRSEDA